MPHNTLNLVLIDIQSILLLTTIDKMYIFIIVWILKFQLLKQCLLYSEAGDEFDDTQ